MEVDVETPEASGSPEPPMNPDIASYCAVLTETATEYQKMFVDMYRSFYPALFESLVKLQLSFLVDLSVDLFLASPEDDLGVNYVRHSSPLRRLFSSSAPRDECSLPPLPMSPHRQLGFRFFLNHLRKPHVLATPFLFRTSGRTSRVKELSEMLLSDEGHVNWQLLDLEHPIAYSPHDVASALKMALYELPQEPLLTARYSTIYAKVAALANPQPDDQGVRHPLEPCDRELRASKQLKALRLLLLLLPEVNCNILIELLDLLKVVSETPTCNMNTEALGIVFGPVLFPPDPIAPGVASCSVELERKCKEINSLVTIMIESYPAVKGIPASIVHAISTILDAHNDPTEAPSTVAYARRRHTAEEVARSYTEHAVAELYAHVAMWPESSRKRRFIRKLSHQRLEAARSVTRRDSRRRLRPRGRVFSEDDAHYDT